MSAQQRYRTLVHHIGRIYAAPEGTRTELLQTGLDQIVSVVGPTNAMAWTTVSADSDRLLKVWVAKEREHNETASTAVAEQLTDMLRELASAPCVCYEPPASMLCDEPVPYSKPLVLAAVVEAPKLVVVEVPAKKSVAADVTETKKPVVEVPKPVTETKKPVVEVITPATIAHVEDDDEFEVEEEDDSSKPPSDDEGEVIEPGGDEEEEEEEEEEEVGMEVEQIMIRGRAWWLEVNTQKIYAVIDGDDVGDEVGEMVSGKPRFYAK
jgi:hypothetical protein